MPGKKAVLSPKRLRFIDEYLIDGNGAQAAIRAGYSERTATNTAYQILQVPEVQEELARRRARISDMADVRTVDVVRGLARVAMVDPRKMFDDDGNPIGIQQLDDDTAMAIAGFDVVTMGNGEAGLGRVTKVRLNDRIAAMDKLMKHLGGYEKDNAQRAVSEAGYDEIASVLKRRLQSEGLSLKDLEDAGDD